MIPMQFVNAVKEMRRLQKDYQKTGNMRVRALMVQKESEVDWLIDLCDTEYERIKPKQQSLPLQFDDTENEPK